MLPDLSFNAAHRIHLVSLSIDTRSTIPSINAIGNAKYANAAGSISMSWRRQQRPFAEEAPAGERGASRQQVAGSGRRGAWRAALRSAHEQEEQDKQRQQKHTHTPLRNHSKHGSTVPVPAMRRGLRACSGCGENGQRGARLASRRGIIWETTSR